MILKSKSSKPTHQELPLSPRRSDGFRNLSASENYLNRRTFLWNTFSMSGQGNKYCHRFPPILFTDQTIEMRDNTASSSGWSFFSPAPQSQPRALLHMSRRKIKSSRDPWSKIVSDWFQQKTIKEFLIGPFKFAQERLNIRCVWCVSGFFPCNV